MREGERERKKERDIERAREREREREREKREKIDREERERLNKIYIQNDLAIHLLLVFRSSQTGPLLPKSCIFY